MKTNRIEKAIEAALFGSVAGMLVLMVVGKLLAWLTKHIKEKSMTKQQFLNYVQTEGVYQACLFAKMMDVPLAQVQLWLKTKESVWYGKPCLQSTTM